MHRSYMEKRGGLKNKEMEMNGGNTTLFYLRKTTEMHRSYMGKSGGLKNREMW